MTHPILDERFKAVDSKDLSGFLDLLTDDHVLVFGNREPVYGKETAGRQVEQFWAMIGGLKHNIQSIREVGDTAFVESLIDYKRLDGRVVRVPCCDVFVMEGDKIRETRAYLDQSPLWE